MKTKSLKINNSCNENWNKMSPNNGGKFCDSCAKTVIDFTHLESKDVFEILKKSKSDTCARVTKSQLNTPYLDIKESKQYQLPYSKTAAGIMLAATITSVQSCDLKYSKVKTEVLAYNITSSTNIEKKNIANERSALEKTVIFSGRTIRPDGSGIENVRITLVTLEKLYTIYSELEGLFSIEIPLEIIDDANVFRFDYDEIIRLEREKEPYGDYFEIEDRVVTKPEIKSGCNILATEDPMYMGMVLRWDNIDKKNSPIVINDGEEVSYKEFNKARAGKKSSCNIKNKGYMSFKPEAAIALYGEKAKYGLYLFSKEIKH